MAGSRPVETVLAVTLVAVGGFVGATTRYAISLSYPGLTGTLIANATGSFLLGIVAYEALYTSYLSDRTRTFVAAGVLSSYTTYSTFVLETVESTPLLAITNVTASYALGFAGVLLGRWIARRIGGVGRE